MKKIAIFCAFILLVSSIFCMTASATPTDAFARVDEISGNTSSVLTREMYDAVYSISSKTLGLNESLIGLNDICFDKDGNVFLLCSGENNSHIYVLNPDYTLKCDLKIVEGENQVNFSGAQGIFVDANYNIYICDTKNGRVIVSDKNGIVTKMIGVPDSSLIPSDFIYKPTSFIMDDKGYFYILSLGCYYGALSYSPEGEFIGFYGANTVKASALATLEFLWDKLTDNDVKKSQSAKTLPYSFVDISADKDGYVITCTGQINYDDNGSGQIRKINSKGSNILYKNSARNRAESSSAVNFLEEKVIRRNKHNYVQNICSISIDENNFIYALDKTYGLVYVFDEECNLVSGFGGGLGNGNKLGSFVNATALAVFNDTVLVSDFDNRSVTVFKLTDYGKILNQAQSMYIRGDTEKAVALWQEVLSMDAGNQFAYRGLAGYYYGEGEYTKALGYAKRGMDYNIYNLSWQAILKQFLADYFLVIIFSIVLLVCILVSVVLYFKKKNNGLVKNEKIRTFFSVIFHPFRGFEEIKYKNKGSWIISFVLMILLFATSVLKSTASGFIFRTTDAQSYNLFYTLLQTSGLLMLWTVANWLVCSMFSGKGKYKEVLVASAYSFTPMIITTLLYVLLSQFIPLSASGIISSLGVIGWIYSLYLLCIAMITIHEYDFFKFLSTSIAVIFFMVVIIFVIFFVYIMISLSAQFVSELYTEIIFR